MIERAPYEKGLRQSDRKKENIEDKEALHHRVTVQCRISAAYEGMRVAMPLLEGLAILWSKISSAT